MHSFVMLMRTPCSKTSVTSLHTCHWITQFSVRFCAQRGQMQRTLCLGCCSRCNFFADGSKNANKTQRVSTPRSTPLEEENIPKPASPEKCSASFVVTHQCEHFQGRWTEPKMVQVQSVFGIIVRSVAPLWRTAKRTLGGGEENPLWVSQ